jgi:hypothetical protein
MLNYKIKQKLNNNGTIRKLFEPLSYFRHYIFCKDSPIILYVSLSLTIYVSHDMFSMYHSSQLLILYVSRSFSILVHCITIILYFVLWYISPVVWYVSPVLWSVSPALWYVSPVLWYVSPVL